MALTLFQSVQALVQTLNNWRLKGGKLVDQNTANMRAAICVSCHNNQASSEVRKYCCGGNRIANIALDKLRQSIIKANMTTKDKNLLTCALCQCDLKIKVWVPNEVFITPADANAFPEFCWAKKITEGKEI